jgi:hypothetical protein
MWQFFQAESRNKFRSLFLSFLATFECTIEAIQMIVVSMEFLL